MTMMSVTVGACSNSILYWDFGELFLVFLAVLFLLHLGFPFVQGLLVRAFVM